MKKHKTKHNALDDVKPASSDSETPEIIKSLQEFFLFWSNPNGLPNGSVPIESFQIQIYFPSVRFIFKWCVEEKDFEEAAKFLGVKLKKKQRVLLMAIGEYNIELQRVKSVL